MLRCKQCGREIKYAGRNRKYCDSCRKERRRSAGREYKIKCKCKSFSNKTLDETLSDLRAYNKRHNTRLSYGKYIAERNGGRL